MARDTAGLIRDALALDVDQRAVVARALIESLEDASGVGESEEEWRDEAVRRLAEVRAGTVEAVEALHADEHHARLRASLTA
ncbi:addiction module protein [Georgenia sp. Z1344]|uniref:addiction module protein n=1 Tax=Georgenia sp. Z1344 TaxID=3416706 RepID=UPI003CF0826F